MVAVADAGDQGLYFARKRKTEATMRRAGARRARGILYFSLLANLSKSGLGTRSTRYADATETATEAGFCIVLDEPKGGKVVALKT